MRTTILLLLAAAMAACGCDKAREAGSDAVDTVAGAGVEGGEKVVQRFNDKYDKRAAGWLKQSEWKVDRVVATGMVGDKAATVDVYAVVRNTGSEKIDLTSILSRDLVLLTAADDVSHKVRQPDADEIIIQPGTAIRQVLTFEIVGGGVPKALTLVGCDPIALPKTEIEPPPELELHRPAAQPA